MKISFDVPNGFLGCGITMVYEDDNGIHMYSTSVTPDEVVSDKAVVLPRQEALEAKQHDDK